MDTFNYEKLDVYRCSMEFLTVAFEINDKLPKGYSNLCDQLRRSALSIPLNIAEGSGKSSPAERRRYFEIARGSALEASAALNCCLALKLTDHDILSNGRTLILRIVQMLSKLAPRSR